MNAKRVIMTALIAGVSGFGLSDTHYVVPYGTAGVTPTPPYTNWPTAGTNLNDVVAAALAASEPRTVWVTNGTYYLSDAVAISKPMTMRSVNGRDLTVVDGNNYPGKPVTNRCFVLSGNDIVLDGFTIRNGYGLGHGGGIETGSGIRILVDKCRIVGCVVTNVTATYAGGGGATLRNQQVIRHCEILSNTNFGGYGGGVCVWSLGGTIANSTVASNVTYAGYKNGTLSAEADGGGVMLMPGVVSNCIFYGNAAKEKPAGGSGFGGAIRMADGSRVVNSLVYGNSASSGAGVWARTSASMLNCTVVSNRLSGSGSGAGVYLSAGVAPNYAQTQRLENVICYFNVSATGAAANYSFTTPAAGYTGTYHIVNSCLYPTNFAQAYPALNVISADNTEADPKLADLAGENYRLSSGSPCINTGTNAGWGVCDLDLDGNRRIDSWSRLIDMGCLEYTVAHGTLLSVQ
ncbi:MAG: choice-of-anchor Q domain-containing protein [Kiritimatiellae bacterium]|nr:choice-of-anchor Q domain-containing protein [Kiritimatiellia bacterium]